MVAVFDVEAFYTALDRRRRRRRLSWRQVVAEAGCRGVSASMMTRVGRGSPPSVANLVLLLHWLGDTDLGPFIVVVDREVVADA